MWWAGDGLPIPRAADRVPARHPAATTRSQPNSDGGRALGDRASTRPHGRSRPTAWCPRTVGSLPGMACSGSGPGRSVKSEHQRSRVRSPPGHRGRTKLRQHWYRDARDRRRRSDDRVSVGRAGLAPPLVPPVRRRKTLHHAARNNPKPVDSRTRRTGARTARCHMQAPQPVVHRHVKVPERRMRNSSEHRSVGQGWLVGSSGSVPSVTSIPSSLPSASVSAVVGLVV